ncbi:hypothetical protein [Paenibacillus sp. FSL H8-0259]|uniref:hypothetical protein n=1 Tax=Paenibacillus sp. FSL H8-0259 TaxID=1920423 RepID=UPI00096C3503|nr:hypothetical protein [Paenibacillus sp. FSL H8-0259]OMF30950.1 hypothetical protein BK132_05840 [Paenibacillus sp. FSL H8-0259]
MRCPACRTEEVKQLNIGKCDKCIEISRTCTECGLLVDPSAVFLKVEDSQEVARGHKDCIDLKAVAPKKTMFSADYQFDPVQDLIAWVNGMSNKKTQHHSPRLIKMRPEIFENLKGTIPIETRSLLSDHQIMDYFGIPLEIVPDLKPPIDYIY